MKVRFLILATAVVTLASCGTSAEKSADATDSTQATQQVGNAIDTASASIQEADDDFVDDRPSDMRTMQVNGPVKRIVVKSADDQMQAIAFNKSGAIFSMRFNKMYAKDIRHNEKGQLVYLMLDNAEFEGAANTEMKWTYNPDGTLLKYEDLGHEYCITYEFKDYKKGLPYTIVVNEGFEATVIEITYTVTYGDLDEHGNWQSRTLNGKGRISEDGGNTYEPHSWNQTETRTIEYYD